MNSLNHIRLNLCDDDDFWKKEFGIRVKLTKGKETKILERYYPKFSLYELNREYYKLNRSDKFMIDEYFSFGLDEKYESFNGFEKFLNHYCRHDFDYYPDLNLMSDQDDICCLHSSIIWDQPFIFGCNIRERLIDENTGQYIIDLPKDLIYSPLVINLLKNYDINNDCEYSLSAISYTDDKKELKDSIEKRSAKYNEFKQKILDH